MRSSTKLPENLTVPERVIIAVAEAKDISPMDLPPTLYKRVDPDALQSLIGRTSDSSVQVTFEFQGCTVTVRGNGNVSATPGEESEQSVTVTPARKDIEDGVSV